MLPERPLAAAVRSVMLACCLVACGSPAESPDVSAATVVGPRVVAFGDVHGDLDATRAALRLAGAIDSRDHWIGGPLTVVQTGDQLDRGDDEPDILALLERLQGEAAAAGGKLIVLDGNHELMNAAGDLRYVTTDGFADYGGESARLTAFAPGGALARQLAERHLYAIVGDTLFVHGGITPADLDIGLDVLDQEVRAWLSGARVDPPRVLTDPSSMVWTRIYGGASDVDCDSVKTVLARLGLKRMVVGHTVQPHINSACGGHLWRIDVGLSHYYGGPREVLAIDGAQVQVLREQR